MLKKLSKPGFFLFVDPFHWQIWVALLCLWLYYASILAFISNLSKRGRGSTNLMEDFTFWQSVQHFSVASLQFGPYKQTVSTGGKILQQSWSILTLIFVATYTANMAAIVSRSLYSKPLRSIDDIVLSNHSVYAHVRYEQRFKDVNNSVINDLIDGGRIEYLNMSISHGWRKAFGKTLQSGGIWIVRSSIVEWLKTELDDGDRLYALDGYFSRVSNGFVMKKNWQHVDKVNELMNKYSQSGIIDRIVRKYTTPQPSLSNENDFGAAINFFTFLGFFTLMFIAGFIALMISFIDYFRRKNQTTISLS